MAQRERMTGPLEMSASGWLPHIASSLITMTSIALIALLWRRIGALPSPEVLLLLTVAAITYIAGGMAGMVSAAIVLFSSFVLFSSETYLFRYSEMDWRQAMLIVVAAPLIALMVGSLREQVDRLRAVTEENGRLQAEVDRLHRAGSLLQSCEERFRLAAESIPGHAIVLLDPHGTVKSWNPGAAAITGYEPHEILGQSYSRLFTRQDILDEQPDRLLERATFTGRVEERGWRLTKSGPQIRAATVISAIKSGAAPAAGFVMVMRDLGSEAPWNAA
jgi:PAS domain S-box-containing protein